jgi:serine/threonine-protein kinase
MAFCHECGSQTAETDVFCPYCGVSLEPVSLGGQETGAADDPFASTIAIDQDDREPAAAPEAGGPGDTAGNSAEVGDESFSEIPTPLFIQAGGVVPETDAPSEEQVETSAADDEKAVEEQVEEPAETAPEENTEEAAEQTEDTAAEDVPAQELSENESVDADPSVAEEIAVPEEPVEEEQAAKAEDEVPVEAIGEAEDCGEEVAEVVLEPESGESTEEDPGGLQAEEPETVESTEEDPGEMQAGEPEPETPIQKPSSSGDLYSEIKPFPDEGISKPAEALDALADVQPPSIFDSVRIMDSDPTNARTVPGDAEPAADAAPAPAGADDGAKSFTTPNIGVVDTDGKRSKLKPLDEGIILNNRYEIVRKIGGGGMGAVYLASDNNLGGVLRAVKEMVQTHIEEEQQDKAINDFKRESMILSTLDHPSIPTIYDYFFDDKENRFYLVMKYISGGDLSSRLRSAPEGRIEERTITEWAIQIADVLDYLHNRPSTIVYRDLKPSNVMLDGNTGKVMLIDFGIARSINQIEEKGVTAVGTMGYAPPELFSGNVEPRSDIYSLGSTMFHLLTGADPQNNPLLIFDFQKNPRPRQINPQLSDQIERILMHSVEYNAQTRFNSAGEMRQILEEHLENLKTGRVTYGVKEIPASIGLANQPVFCGFCGQKIVATDMFCAFCGAKQPLAQQGVHAEIYARSAMTARLMVIGTNELDTPAFTLEKDENLVGRRDPMSNIFPEIDLSKFDPQTKISRRHAKIWRDGSSFLVEDLGSSNGTILLPVVNDSKRLSPHQPHILANGDKIKMGDTTLHFVIG